MIRDAAVPDEHSEHDVVQFVAEAAPNATTELSAVLARIVRTLRAQLIERIESEPAA